MTASTTVNGAFPKTARDAFGLYFDLGVRTVPNPHCSKNAGALNDGWSDLRLTPDDRDAHFPPGVPRNIGALLGPVSRGLADTDLDCAEAVTVGRLLLPKTGWRFGRKTRRSSHYEYRVAGALKTREYKDTDGKMIVELRYSGQTIYPPSDHEDTGEPIEWEAFSEPAEVAANELLAAVNQTAAATLLAHHWPAEGGRHDAAMHLAGGLLRAKWTIEQAEGFIGAICAAAGDDEVMDRIRTVASTAEKLAAGEDVTGWPKLVEAVGEAVVSRVRQWLRGSAFRGVAGAGASAKPTVKVVEVEPYRPFPLDALPEPLRSYAGQGAVAMGCDPSFIALPALAAVAGLIGNKRTICLKRGWCEPAVLWSVIVGDSGTLKSPALALAVGPLHRQQRRYLDEYKAKLREHARALAEYKKKKRDDPDADPLPPEPPVCRRVVASDTTVERLAVLLDDNPLGLLVARDELSGWLRSFNQYKAKGGSDLANWLEMHRAGAIIVDRKTGERNTLFVAHAAVSVTGGIQPGVLARALTPEAREAGLAARLLPAWPPRRPKRWTEAEVDPDVIGAYERLLDSLAAMEPGYDEEGHPVPIAIRFDRPAKAAWVEFYNEWAGEQDAAEGDLAAAFSKLEGYAARLALVHHVVTRIGTGTDVDGQIGLASVEAGVTLTRWFSREASRIYAALDETEDETNARRLVEFIRARGGRITARALQKSNSRKYRDAEQAKAALDELARAGLGYWTKPETGPQGGQLAAWFVLSSDGTTDSTDSTSDGDDDGGGPGARHYPPPPAATPENPQETPGTVGTVGSAAERNGFHQADGGRDRAGGVVSDTRRGDDGAVATTPYVLVTDAADLPMVATAVGETALVGLDCETTGLNPRTDKLRLLSLRCDTTDGGTVVYVVDCFAVDPASLWEALRDRPVVGHNLSFDLQFLARLGFEPGECRDTMLMSQVLHAGTGRPVKHTLAACCERELGETVGKDEQRSDWSGTLTPEQLRYAALDAVLTRRLHDALTPKLVEAGLADAAAIENRAATAVAWLSSSGVAFSRGCWDALAAVAQAEAERLADELDQAAPRREQAEMFGSGWKWDSPQHVAEALAAVGHPVADTHDNTLAAIDHPLAALLRDYRAATKLATTYGPKWLKKSFSDGRIYAAWHQLGANSGRMACSSPNLQNLPRDTRYRRCFAALPGRVLVKADFSQIELRIAAKVANETAMIEAYRRGDDLHTLTARRLLGNDNVSKADRQLAKAVNFGLLYGMGAKNFRVYARSKYRVELTEAQAEQYRQAFFSAYPDLRRWHAGVGRTKDQPIETRTLAGRRCLNVSRFSEKLNLGVQGTGADGLKAALALLWDRRAECPGAVPVLAVHDEIVVECDAGQADAAATWLKQAMLDGMAPLVAPVPVEVEVTAAPTWGG